VHKNGFVLIARLGTRPVAFLPGGRVEPGETLQFAMCRELREETGCEAAALSYLGCIEHIWAEGETIIHDLTHFFLADTPTLTPESTPLCADDGVEMFWMPVASIEQTPIEPSAQKVFIRRAIAGDKTPWWAFVEDRNDLA
jgi:8-oxo-dGTP pyrophosphatase MutT (NUDIX family)